MTLYSGTALIIAWLAIIAIIAFLSYLGGYEKACNEIVREVRESGRSEVGDDCIFGHVEKSELFHAEAKNGKG